MPTFSAKWLGKNSSVKEKKAEARAYLADLWAAFLEAVRLRLLVVTRLFRFETLRTGAFLIGGIKALPGCWLAMMEATSG